MDLSGYPPLVVDKIHRLFDILEQISKVRYLSDRLSFYGGTALNFIHFNNVPRLSVDLDFNYRHLDAEEEWREIREEIDELLKRVLKDLGYFDDDIKIQAQYPLGRLDVRYDTVLEMRDNIKLEIGYMRRMPILKEDMLYQMVNPGSGAKFTIRSPVKEELFANKFCTMISRNKTQMNARDVFDVFSISRSGFNMDMFLDIVMIEGLMMGLDHSDPHIFLNPGSISNIRDLVSVDIDLRSISDDVNSFNKDVFDRLEKREWSAFKYNFENRKKLDHSYFGCPEKINAELYGHPQIQWILAKDNR